MAISLNTSYASLITQTNLNKTNNALSTSQQRLSTGMRINSAADDAAGLQIATRLDSSARGMAVAMRNSNDGISLLQTAEGAFDEMTKVLQRMQDLSTQAANDTYSEADRDAMQAEYDQLGSELTNIFKHTKYAGENLFTADGTAVAAAGKLGTAANKLTFQIGTTGDEKMEFNTATQIGEVQTKLVAVSSFFAATEPTTADTKITGTTGSTANGNLTALKEALDEVGTLRSQFGAAINRLGHTHNNLANMRDNTEAARLQIMSTDYAMESANMTQNSMKMQAGISMLNQSGQMSGLAMSLLG